MPRHLFNQRHPSRSAPVPPLPHPSWRAADAGTGPSSQAIDAQEFWQRLGL